MTVFLDNNRGKFEEGSLAVVLKELNVELGSENLALELGFEEPRFLELLQVPAITLPGDEGEPRQPKSGVGGHVTSENVAVKMVPLYLKPEEYEEFQAQLKQLATKWEIENVTDTVKRAVALAAGKK